MLRKEQNDLLTQTGPGTPLGQLFRSYWLPALLAEVAEVGDPHVRGKALVGDKQGLWRYRIGDYRVICKLEDCRLVILVLSVGHRREIYD